MPGELGQDEHAVTAIAEAAAISRRLARERPNFAYPRAHRLIASVVPCPRQTLEPPSSLSAQTSACAAVCPARTSTQPPPRARHLRRGRLAGAALALAATAGVLAISGGASPAAAAGCVKPPHGMRAMGALSPGAAHLAQFIGRQLGQALLGNGPLTLGAGQVRALGNQVPTGARVDACRNSLTFTSRDVSFVVEAVPRGNPDMTFRIAGLVNPTVRVPLDARVRVEFVNADTDEAHGWLVTAERPPFAFRPPQPTVFRAAAAGVIGDPTSRGSGARTIAFVATRAGTYHYACPLPGHAAMGMHGTFIVR